MPDGRGTGRQSLYSEDERGGEELQGLTKGAGELPRVQEGLGEGVTGCEPPNPARRGKGWSGTGRKWRRKGQQYQGVQDGGSGEGRAEALTS